jgi:hypothetical protein
MAESTLMEGDFNTDSLQPGLPMTMPAAPEPQPIDLLVPNSDLHTDVLDRLMKRLNYSERTMSKFYSRWNVSERKVQAYINLPDYEQILKAMTKSGEPPQIVSITVPYTYATIWTIVTYLIHTFCGQKPMFQIQANSAESVQPAMNMETVLQYNADHNRLVANMFQWFLDDNIYGVGIIRNLWVEEKANRTVFKPMSMGGLMMPGMQPQMTKVRESKTVYEGNEAINVDPFMFFPDPRGPMNQVSRKGEFVFWRSFESKGSLKLAEMAGSLKYIDEAGEMPRGQTEGTGGSVRNLISEGDASPGDPLTRDSRTDPFIQIDQGTVLLVPTEWGLGPSTTPEKWIFTILNKKQIAQAQPFDYDHSRHPVVVIESNTFGYGFGQVGIVDMLGPIQDSLSWFINSHIYNVRSVLNNMWVVDPSMVEMQDLKTPGPGKIIRLKRGAIGQDIKSVIQQLTVQDVTANHIGDMDMFMRIGDSLSAINDNLRGIQSSGGRKTATEIRTSGEAGASRLAAKARYISAQGMVEIAEQMSLNCQQFMSMDFYALIVGQDGLKAPLTISPEMITGDFHYPISDGTLPIDKTALLDVWKEIWLAVAQNPMLAQTYDAVGIFDYMAQLGGAKNLSQFKVQVQPDQMVGNGVANGQLQNAGPGPMPVRSRPNGAVPGQQ